MIGSHSPPLWSPSPVLHKRRGRGGRTGWKKNVGGYSFFLWHDLSRDPFSISKTLDYSTLVGVLIIWRISFDNENLKNINIGI